MQLYSSPTSPYARKVMIVAHETSLAPRIDRIGAKPHPVERDQAVVQKNPLGKVPTLVTDEGLALFDSRVICEYLASIAGNTQIFPVGEARWESLSLQALADGILDAALLIRYEETLREPDRQSDPWKTGQWEKLISGLDLLDQKAAFLSFEADIGQISVGCALGYLDFRFTSFDWRSRHPRLAAWLAEIEKRPSFVETRHHLPA